METKKKYSKIQLPRQLDAIERLKFGVRPTIGRNTYIVPTDKLDALLMHLNGQSIDNNAPAPSLQDSTPHQTEQEDGPETQEEQNDNPQQQEQENHAQNDNEPSIDEQSNQEEDSQCQDNDNEHEQSEQSEQNNQQDAETKHPKYDTIIKILKKGKHIPYLYGPAGTGKNHVCEQIAKDLGLVFYMSSKVDDMFALKGFIDGHGNYQATPLYHAVTKGGLFLFDEYDASDSNAVVGINSLTANGYIDFPNCEEPVKAHPNFKLILAGNTLGKGADGMYTGRNQLDAASLNRVSVIPFDYDENIETKIAEGDGELVQFCRKIRNICKEMQYDMIMSYRNIQRICDFAKDFSLQEALELGFCNEHTKDDMIAISGAFANAKDKYGKTFYNMFN